MSSDRAEPDKLDCQGHPGFRELLSRVADGSQEAAWELLERHGDGIFRAVRRSLDSSMRQRFDSGDFVQLVWASFFKARGGFDRFSSPNELAAFLVGMARNKVAAEARRCLIRPTSNMNRERYLDDSNDDIAQSLQSSEAEPVDVAIAKEQYERFLESQPDHYRQIVELRLAGHTQRDVASQVGLAECTVHRFLNKLCQRIGD